MAAFSLSACWSILVVMATVHTTLSKLVDLSHDHYETTFMFTAEVPKYKKEVMFKGEYAPGVFLQYYKYSIGEHGGTHIDSPSHFSRTGYAMEKIPLENTIVDGVMIDCSKETSKDPEYVLSLQKVKDWEKKHGKIPPKSAVIINFNWSGKFKDTKAYLGTKDITNTSSFRYPTVSVEAADFLAKERDILILGTDTMSPDSVTSKFPVHVAILPKNKMLVENIKDAGRLPARGFRFHASPVKFVGASGVQVRAYAIVNDVLGGGAPGLSGHSVFMAFVAMLVPVFTRILSVF